MTKLVQCLICSALLFANVSGCQAFHSYRPECIEVRDRETNKPIAGVQVRISYPLEDPSFAPWDSKGITGADGIARLRAAPYGCAGIMLQVTANGYMDEMKMLKVQEVEAVEPAHWFEDVNQRPAKLVMELYAMPSPTIELVVPAGYRGEVKAKIEVQAEMPDPDQPTSSLQPGFVPGQRSFSYAVQCGVIEVSGPLLFRHVTPWDLRFKFADNVPLSRQAKETPLGYWWLKCENHYHYFLIGTQQEYDDYRRSLPTTISGDGKRSGGGQGRHGHRGIRPSADPSNSSNWP